MRTRLKVLILMMSIMIIGAFTFASTPAEALPNGVYFLRCDSSGRCICYNILGVAVADYGMCYGLWAETIIVNALIPNPHNPILSPPNDPVWEGYNAWWWVSFLDNPVRLNPPVPPINVQPLLNQDLPTLTCNEAHFHNRGD